MGTELSLAPWGFSAWPRLPWEGPGPFSSPGSGDRLADRLACAVAPSAQLPRGTEPRRLYTDSRPHRLRAAALGSGSPPLSPDTSLMATHDLGVALQPAVSPEGWVSSCLRCPVPRGSPMCVGYREPLLRQAGSRRHGRGVCSRWGHPQRLRAAGGWLSFPPSRRDARALSPKPLLPQSVHKISLQGHSGPEMIRLCLCPSPAEESVNHRQLESGWGPGCTPGLGPALAAWGGQVQAVTTVGPLKSWVTKGFWAGAF